MATKDETQTVLPVVQSEAVVQVQTMEHHLEGPGIVLRQKTSECCRFFTCQPNIDWLIHPPHPHGDASDFGDPRFADTLAAKFWIQEDATYCNRVWSCWAPGCRETTYRTLPTSFAGTAIATDADSLMTHKKGGTCGVNSIVLFSDQGAVRCPMCCCLPFMDTLDNNGAKLGTTEYMCDQWCFVPKFKVNNAQDQLMYMIRPDVCCMGCCVKCKCDGQKGKCFRVPFYIRDPQTMDPIDTRQAVITDLWAGMKAECCTRKNMYSLTWPKDSPRDMRAVLIGASLLIDITQFEQEGS